MCCAPIRHASPVFNPLYLTIALYFESCKIADNLKQLSTKIKLAGRVRLFPSSDFESSECNEEGNPYARLSKGLKGMAGHD